MRRFATLLACILGLSAPGAVATSTTSADYSDLWWNAAESGWGAHMTLQDDVVFMVLYVYDEARRPLFLVAPDMRRQAGSPSVHEGTLHRTTGPAFSAGTFDPGQVGNATVGTARLEFVSPAEARLEYTVSGIRVRKTITRQYWRIPNVAGEYVGGLFASATASTCPLGLPSIAYPGIVTVSQDGETVSMEMAAAPGFSESATCRMSGRLVPQGALASITGTYACEFSSGIRSNGTFELAEVEAGPHGFGGRYAALEGQACRHSGYLGGTRRSRGSAASALRPEP